MLDKIGANACVLRPSLNLSQHVDVEQDRGNCFCFGPLNLSQHMDVRGKRLNCGAFSKSLAAHRC